MLTKLNNSNSCQSNAVIDKKITDLQKEVDTISDNVTALTGDVAQNASDIHDLQNCVASGVFENNVEAQTVQADNGVVTDKIAPNVESDVCVYGGVNTPKVVATDIEATTLTVNNVPFTDTLADINCAKSDASNAVCTANDSLTCAQNVKCELDDYKDALTCCVETASLKTDYACIDSIESPSACISCIENVNAKADFFVNGNKTYKDSDTFVEPTVKDLSDYYLWKLPRNIIGLYQMVGVDENDNIKFTVTIDANNSDTSVIGMKRVAYSADSLDDFKIIAVNKTHDQLFFVSKSDIKRLYVSSDTWNTKTLPEYEIYPSLSTLPQFDYSITTSQSSHTYFIGDSESNNGGVSVCGNFEANTVVIPDQEMNNLYIKDNAYLGYDSDTGAYTSCGRPGGIITYCDNLDWANGCPRTVVRKGACFDEDQWGNQCSYLTYEAVKHETTEFTPEETPDTLFDEASLAHYKGRVSDGQDPASYSYPLTHLGDCSCVHGCLDVQSGVRTNKVNSRTGCPLLLLGERGLNVCSCCDMSIRANLVEVKAKENYVVEACCHAKICAKTGCVRLISDCCSITACANCNVDLVSGNQVYIAACSKITEYSNTGCITRTAACILDSAGTYTVCAPTIELCGNVCVDANYGLDVPYLCTQNIISNYCLRTNVACNYVENVTLNKCTCACNIVTDACEDIVNRAGCSFCICAPVTNIDNTTNVNILKVKCCVDGRLEVNGDVRAHGQLISEGDTVVHGDLLVDGSITTNCQEEIVSTGDYITLRENNNTPLTSTTYSGVAVNNYANGCMATITADYCGEWRVSDSSTITSCSYTNVSNYNGNWYSGLTQTAITVEEGIHKNIDFLELSDVVLYNGDYYHHNGSEWYGPISVVNGRFDLGALITDAAVISALSALTSHSLVYYINLTVVQIDASANQPLLTRDEASCFNNNDILVWDCTNHKATHIPRPTLNDTQLTAQVDGVTGCVDYCWTPMGGDANNATCFNGCTYACAMADFIDHVYPLGSVYQNLTCSTNPGTLLGVGTWEQITDRVIMARGSTYTACGGASIVTLCTCHLPAHCHSQTNHCHSGTVCSGGAASDYFSTDAGYTKSSGIFTWTDSKCGAASKESNFWREGQYNFNLPAHTHTFVGGGVCSPVNTGSTGSGCSFSIIPPYCAVYTWYRCA